MHIRVLKRKRQEMVLHHPLQHFETPIIPLAGSIRCFFHLVGAGGRGNADCGEVLRDLDRGILGLDPFDPELALQVARHLTFKPRECVEVVKEKRGI